MLRIQCICEKFLQMFKYFDEYVRSIDNKIDWIQLWKYTKFSIKYS